MLIFISGIICAPVIYAADSQVFVEYLNETKSLVLTGTAAGVADDSATVFVYEYSAATQGIANKNAPIVFDAFILGEGGAVNHEVLLPDSLPGGKYVVSIATRGNKTEKTFMHINDQLVPSALAAINAASKSAFMEVLAKEGPGCGLDPDIYEENKSEVSRVLYSYRRGGFASADSFLKLANQAIAASLIKKGVALNEVLSSYGSYLTELKDGSAILIDCVADYEKMDDNVKSAFADAVKDADFASEDLFTGVYRKLLIYTQFNVSENWAQIRDVVEGTKDEAPFNNNPEILDIDMNTFKKLKNSDEVYRKLFKSKGKVEDFDDIKTLFENIADECYDAEKKPSSGGASGGSSSRPSGGSASVGSSISTSGMSAITPELIENKDTTTKLTDIEGHWAQKSIETLIKNRVISGYEDGSFKPDANITRAEFVTMMVKAFGFGGDAQISFSDVPPTSWAYSYIKSAYAAGLITGYEDGSFGADDIITREQAAVIIHRAVNTKITLPEGVSSFTDISEFSAYASRAILDLAGAGLISGTGDSLFSPKQNTTRAQTATLLNNALEYIAAQ